MVPTGSAGLQSDLPEGSADLRVPGSMVLDGFKTLDEFGSKLL